MTNRTSTIQAKAQQYLMNNYGERTMAFVRGEGIYVWDAEGHRYVDLLSGLGVNNLGHCHPNVVHAIQSQAETLLHVSNLYLIEPQVELADLLVNHSCADKVFFCNSGAEANESAIKMARKYSFDRYNSGRHRIITLENSFHGRTLAALTATGQPKHQKGFHPLVPGFEHVPINDTDAMRKSCDDSVCAVLIEPIQGEGGVHCCEPSYLQEVRRICDEKDILLIFDEVQCGLGRSGHLFASDEYGVEPDMITIAKSLASGVPIGALVAKEPPADTFVPGSHAATFGGNPLSCAAGVATMKTLINENLAERSNQVGERFQQKLRALQSNHSEIRDVRGKGLMIGVEMKNPVGDLVRNFRAQGFIVGAAGPNVLRFLPPLIIEEDQLNRAVETLDQLLSGIAVS